MHPDLFTDSWVDAWAQELNASETYHHAARHWTWPIVLVLRADPAAGLVEDRMVYLDLFHGECREARMGTAADRARVKYVIAGDLRTWQRILERELDPVLALVQRKLDLERGGLLGLTRHVRAAKELVNAAIRASAGAEPTALEPVPRPEATPLARPFPRRFVTMSAAGLDQRSLPMRLYHKAKRLGTWDPTSIDLSRDVDDWARLSDLEREVIMHLTALFQAGEESVTSDILPLMLTVAREGRVEEELYLSTFLFEEAKHTEFFRRFLDEVAHVDRDLSPYHGEQYRAIFHRALPDAMDRLLVDASPRAQVEASVTYNMIVEGTLAETGYHAYHAMLERNDLLPGLREGIGLLKRDESRHIAYGIYLLSRLVADDPTLWPVLEHRMRDLLESTLGIIHELFDHYEHMPFGLQIDDFLGYALGQFNSRLARIESARDGAVLPVEELVGD